MECPQCHGGVWDNRSKPPAASGNRPPDFACKDKNCGWKQWPPKKQGSGGPPVTAPYVAQVVSPAPVLEAPRPVAAPSRTGSAKWTWETLADTYANCYAIAEQRLIDASKVGPRLGFTQADILQATATLFIEVCRNGVQNG